MYNQIHRIAYVSAVIFLCSAWLFVGCQSNGTDETTTESVQENNTALSPTEWQMFEESAESTIANNEARIKVLREKIKKSNTPNIDKIRQSRIDALEDKNTALREKLLAHREDAAESTFRQLKEEIQKELTEMEATLKELDK